VLPGAVVRGAELVQGALRTGQDPLVLVTLRVPASAGSRSRTVPCACSVPLRNALLRLPADGPSLADRIRARPETREGLERAVAALGKALSGREASATVDERTKPFATLLSLE